MPQNHSMDIVSEIDLQEADNAVNQAMKEINQRYDLKDSKTTVDLNKKEKNILINTRDEYSRKASIDILQSKFIKREIETENRLAKWYIKRKCKIDYKINQRFKT